MANAGVCGQLDRTGDANHLSALRAGAFRLICAGYPDMTLSEVQRNLPPLSRSYRERISEGLRSVGLPD